MSKPAEPREYDWCAKHGDLSKRYPSHGWRITMSNIPIMKPICMLCAVEWMESMFPVERRKE